LTLLLSLYHGCMSNATRKFNQVEAETIAWEGERRPAVEKACEEIKRLRVYGNPETQRAICIIGLCHELVLWSPKHERDNESKITSETAHQILDKLKEVLSITEEAQ